MKRRPPRNILEAVDRDMGGLYKVGPLLHPLTPAQARVAYHWFRKARMDTHDIASLFDRHESVVARAIHAVRAYDRQAEGA